MVYRYSTSDLTNPFQQGFDQAQARTDVLAQRQAGNALAQTASPAAAPLFQSGQLDAGSKVQAYQQDQQKQALAQHLDFLGKAADAISQVPDDPGHTARRAAIGQIAPALLQMGYKPQDIDQLQNSDLSDQTLGMFKSQVKLQLEKIGNDIVGVTPNGQSRVVYKGEDPTPKHDWKEVINPDGSSRFIDLNAPQTAPATPSTTPAAPTANQPRGVRNNNPLNLQPLSSGQWAGQTGTDGRYATFATPEAGMAAADQNLQAYATKHGISTLAGVITRWAPPNENDTAAYIKTVANDLGVDPNAKLDLSDPQVRQSVLQSMSKVELGKGASASQAPASAATVAAGGIPGSAPGTKGRNAQWQILVDPKTNTPYRYNAANAQATTLDGKPYTPSGASKISGGGTPRSASALAVQRYIQANPDATPDDISQFNAKMKMQSNAATAFGTGKQGQTINSINVAVDHLGTMRQASDALRNGNIQLFNKIGNDFAAATGNDAPTNFDAVKQIVADEVVKSIVGSGAAAGDREKAQAILNRANSPEQLGGAISEIQKLMAGQLRGLRLQYKNSTGQSDFETHLLPETRQQLERLEPSSPSGPQPAKNRPPLSAIFGR